MPGSSNSWRELVLDGNLDMDWQVVGNGQEASELPATQMTVLGAAIQEALGDSEMPMFGEVRQVFPEVTSLSASSAGTEQAAHGQLTVLRTVEAALQVVARPDMPSVEEVQRVTLDALPEDKQEWGNQWFKVWLEKLPWQSGEDMLATLRYPQPLRPEPGPAIEERVPFLPATAEMHIYKLLLQADSLRTIREALKFIYDLCREREWILERKKKKNRFRTRRVANRAAFSRHLVDQRRHINRLFQANPGAAMLLLKQRYGTQKRQPHEPSMGAIKSFFDEKFEAPVAVPPINCRKLPQAGVGMLDLDFSSTEVQCALKTLDAKAAKGYDGVGKDILVKLDGDGTLLAAFFSACLRAGAIPTELLRARMKLLYKKGSAKDVGNWRPIMIQTTLYKLLMKMVHGRLMDWAERYHLLSDAQKGFRRAPGVHEHGYLVRTAIMNARRSKSDLYMVFCDLKEAFTSVQHETLLQQLEWAGVGPRMLGLLRFIFTHLVVSASEFSPRAETQTRVRQGIPQGDACGPVFFLFAIEYLIRSLPDSKPFEVDSNLSLKTLAFADDLVILTSEPGLLAEALRKMQNAAEDLCMRFNVSKCATLSIVKGKLVPACFRLQGERVQSLMDDNLYKYLGVPTGFRPPRSDEDLVRNTQELVRMIDSSELWPWHKVSALKQFVLSKFMFPFRALDLDGITLSRLRMAYIPVVKRWMGLSVAAPTNYLGILPSRGGVSVLDPQTLADLAALTEGLAMLSSVDYTIRQYSVLELMATANRLSKTKVTHIIEPLIMLSTGQFCFRPSQTTALWERVFNAVNRLTRFVAFTWFINGKTGLVEIKLGNENRIYTERQGQALVKAVRRHLSDAYITQLRGRHSTKSLRTTALSTISNQHALKPHFFGAVQWRFVFRARLDALMPAWRGLERCVPHGKLRTSTHILCGCFQLSSDYTVVSQTFRHNEIQHLLKSLMDEYGSANDFCFWDRAIASLANETTLTDHDSALNILRFVKNAKKRPDLVCFNFTTKRVVVIDFHVAGELSDSYWAKLRATKLQKYEPLCAMLRSMRYSVYMDLVLYGCSGAYDPANEYILGQLTLPTWVRTRFKYQASRLVVKNSQRLWRDYWTNYGA